MRSFRPTWFALVFVLMIPRPAPADVMSLPGTPSTRPLSTPPEVARNGPESSDPLALSRALSGLIPEVSPLLRRGQENGLANSTLDGPIAPESAEAAPLVLPELVDKVALGPPATRLAQIRPAGDPDVASSPSWGTNVRIPEPASVTLVAAGLIGLIARNRLRRDAIAKKSA